MGHQGQNWSYWAILTYLKCSDNYHEIMKNVLSILDESSTFLKIKYGMSCTPEHYKPYKETPLL